MKEKIFKIIVRGGYGLTNFGDDALLKSLHEDYFSDFKNRDLAYSCTNVEYLKKYIPGFDILPLNTNYNEMCETLVYGGGTQFYSFDKNGIREKISNNIQLLKRPIALINKVFSVLHRKSIRRNTKALSLKSIALGIGVGPFLSEADPKVEENVKHLFKRMEFVGVRDVYSYNKCKEWGIENYNLYADLCFKMSHPLFFKQNINNSIQNIGIIVRDWNRTKEGGSYREALMQFTNNVEKDNIKVHFFVFAKNSDMGWINYLSQKERNYDLWDPDVDDFNNYLEKLDVMDVFVTARYHGAIFASMLGKPFITIEVEQKLKMVSELFSNGSQNWSYPFDPSDLHNKYLEINNNYVNNSLVIAKTANEQRGLAFKMYDDLQIKLKTFK